MIKKILDKYVFCFFKKKQSPISIPSKEEIRDLLLEEEYVCRLSFRLTKNEEIDIEFIHTDVHNMGLEDISIMAEKYANLIVLINNGFLKKQFLNTIKSYQKRQTNNEKTNLLLENIIFFDKILQEELSIIQKEYEPIIRPSAVFRST